MSSNDKKMVIGVFQNSGHAEAAIDNLRHANFSDESIGFISADKRGTGSDTTVGKAEKYAEHGAITGALAGTVVGALAGATATILIPGLGSMLFGGILFGMAAGAAGGSYLGPFVEMGVTENEAEKYHQDFQAGRTIVAVREDERIAEAADILRRHGAERTCVHSAAQPEVPIDSYLK